MSARSTGRREFLRLAALGSFGLAAACSKPSSSVAPTPSVSIATMTPTATPGARALAWSRIDAAGPPARREHTLTANADGTKAFLFGGRTGSGKTLGDLWVFDRGRGDWKEIRADGPAPRFGHSAVFPDDRLLVFGGQSGGKFFDDLWSFDPETDRWTKANTPRAPAARYGQAGDAIGPTFVITHGFTFATRFDDTWRYGDGSDGWKDVSPRSGSRPVKRCLHRALYLSGSKRMVLYGGQTNGTPYLDDTWLYDPDARKWRETTGRSPGARNLYAAITTADRLYLFGGKYEKGVLDDLWSFDGRTWERLDAKGSPPARGGAEGARTAGPGMLVFGGTDGSDDLDDLWELTLPA